MFLQNNAILSVDSDGIVSVSGGSFSMNGLSKASVIQGQIEILGNNLLVSGSSQLEVDGTRSSLKVDGGDFVVDQSGSLVLFNSGRLDVLNGESVCKANGSLSLSNNALFKVTSSQGRATFTDSCRFSAESSSVFYSQGASTFSSSSSLKLAFSEYQVVQSSTVFQDRAKAELSLSAKLTVSGGNLTMSDSSLFSADGASLLVKSGVLTQRDISRISLSNLGTLRVSGSVHQVGASSLFLENSKMQVLSSGSQFSSSNSASVSASLNSRIEISDSGALSLGDQSIMSLASGSVVSLSGGSGTYKQSGQSKAVLSNSNLESEGSVLLSDQASLLGTSTKISILSGGLIVNNTATINISSKSTFAVQNGNVLFSFALFGWDFYFHCL